VKSRTRSYWALMLTLVDAKTQAKIYMQVDAKTEAKVETHVVAALSLRQLYRLSSLQ
jgi:hypothetical protein